jgi:hypothetical protein
MFIFPREGDPLKASDSSHKGRVHEMMESPDVVKGKWQENRSILRVSGDDPII